MLCKACGHRPRFSEQSISCEDEEPTLELLCEHLTADRYRALPAPSASAPCALSLQAAGAAVPCRAKRKRSSASRRVHAYDPAMRGDLRRARRFAAVSALAGVGLGVPRFLDPYRWARGFGWPREPETDVGLTSVAVSAHWRLPRPAEVS